MLDISLKTLHTETYLPTISDLIKKLPQIFLLYFFIFQPPFISRTSYFILELFLFVIFIVLWPNSFNTIIKKFITESLFFIIIITYTLLRDVLKGEEVFIFRFVSWSFQCFFFSIVIIAFLNRKIKIDSPSVNVFSILFWSIILAAISSTILLLDTTLNDLYKSLIIIDPTDVSPVE